MKEDYLHYLWRLKKFRQDDLRTTQGEPIAIEQFGTLNTDAGPDFLNARLTIGDTRWAGNVEMHLKSSDWLVHNHSQDLAYNNVILHVVLHEDVPITNSHGKRIPCLELHDRLPPALHARYLRLLHEQGPIPCHKLLPDADLPSLPLWLDRLLIERLERKATAVKATLEATRHDWEVTMLRTLARYYGGTVNGAAFEQMIERLPLPLLLRERAHAEALVFGQAGFLSDTTEPMDDYRRQLAEAYGHLQHKHRLTPLPSVMFKFARLRPAGFPTVRLAQLAALLRQAAPLFSHIKSLESVSSLTELFATSPDSYWDTRYRFGEAKADADAKPKVPGQGLVHSLIINAVVPVLFAYAQSRDDAAMQERVLEWLHQLKAEQNTITRIWKKLGIRATSAHQSQALIQLKREYCDAFRCLECSIGNRLLSTAPDGEK